MTAPGNEFLQSLIISLNCGDTPAKRSDPEVLATSLDIERVQGAATLAGFVIGLSE